MSNPSARPASTQEAARRAAVERGLLPLASLALAPSRSPTRSAPVPAPSTSPASGRGTVTPVDVRTGKAAGPLNVGIYNYPTVITITGQTAVVIEPYGYSVELINLKTRRVFPRSRAAPSRRPSRSPPDGGDGRRSHRREGGGPGDPRPR